MGPRALLVPVLALVLGVTAARAETLRAPSLRAVFAALQTAPTVPAEWAGIWETTDSSYTCTGIFLDTDVGGLDTLCAGIPITQQDPSGEIELTCTGTATADEVHVTCTGSEVIFPDCEATLTLQLDGTRTGDTYAVTAVMNSVTQGTGEGCGSALCQEARTSGTRIAPEPTEYCATQNETTTWGRVKVLYR